MVHRGGQGAGGSGHEATAGGLGQVLLSRGGRAGGKGHAVLRAASRQFMHIRHSLVLRTPEGHTLPRSISHRVQSPHLGIVLLAQAPGREAVQQAEERAQGAHVAAEETRPQESSGPGRPRTPQRAARPRRSAGAWKTTPGSLRRPPGQGSGSRSGTTAAGGRAGRSANCRSRPRPGERLGRNTWPACQGLWRLSARRAQGPPRAPGGHAPGQPAAGLVHRPQGAGEAAEEAAQEGREHNHRHGPQKRRVPGCVESSVPRAVRGERDRMKFTGQPESRQNSPPGWSPRTARA